MKAELYVLACVDGAQIEMDDEGRFWRLATKSRTGRLIPCERQRAEKVSHKGYLVVRANGGGKMRCAFAHRLVWMKRVGDIPAEVQINHKNGDKKDNRLVNLELCTGKENTQHAIKNGMMPRRRGERHPRAKLTDAQVKEIRFRHAGGERPAELARAFGVTHQAIAAVLKRGTWSHV